MNIKEAYLKVLGLDQQKPLSEGKMGRPNWVPESVVDEDVSDFMGAVAQAHKSGKDTFKFGQKSYKVTMGKDTASKIHKKMEESADEVGSDDKSEVEIDACDKCGKVHEGSCSKTPESKDDVKEESEYQAFIDALTEGGLSESEIKDVLASLEEKKHVGTDGPDAAPPQEMGDNLSDGELDFVDMHEIEVIDVTPEDPKHAEGKVTASKPVTTPVNQKTVIDYPNKDKPEVAVKSQATQPK